MADMYINHESLHIALQFKQSDMRMKMFDLYMAMNNTYSLHQAGYCLSSLLCSMKEENAYSGEISAMILVIYIGHCLTN